MSSGSREAWLERCRHAAAYSAQFRGVSLVVQLHGELLYEDYPDGGGARPHDLASGTKSFAGILAATAAADGLLSLDEPLVGTLPEWEGDPRKSRITVRQLLQLVSGIEAGGKAGHAPSYEHALGVRCVADPGRVFLYGAAPFQVFGEFMRRKLFMLGEDPLVYLQARVLDPIGLHIARWRRGHDGWPNFSAGAVLTARHWARLGELIRQEGRMGDREIIPAHWLRECFQGSVENPVYGLAWWLNAPLPEDRRAHLRQATLGLEDLGSDPAIPRDLVYAAGAAKQRLYVSPALGLVVARQAKGILEALASGERGGFSDLAFLRLLLGPDRTERR